MVTEEYRNYLNTLKAQVEERKTMVRQMKSEEKRADKDSIDREVIAYRQSEAERLERERVKKTELQNIMRTAAPQSLHQRTGSQNRLDNENVAAQDNKSRISNNPLAMELPTVDTNKREAVRNNSHNKQAVVDPRQFADNRQTYAIIRHKNGNAGVAYNILTGM